MKLLRIISLTVIAIFVSHVSAIAQDIETKVTHLFSVNGNHSWRKYFYSGTPATIFAYKKKADTYTFGFYSDDYAGIIDLKINPFDIEEKKLKKLPNAQGKNVSQLLMNYYNKACAKAREKATKGKYRIRASNYLLSDYYCIGSVSKNDSLTLIGYKEIKDFLGTTYYYAIINNDAAGVFHTHTNEHLIIEDIPLFNLPSTDDSQVKSIIEKERRRIVAERQAKEEQERTLAYEKKLAEREEEKRLEAEWRARQDSIDAAKKQEDFVRLKALSPAFIEVNGWSIDSAGGIEVDITFTNCSSQRVKYVYCRGYFLNAVGDRCRNEITRSTEWKYRGIGPIEPFPKSADDCSYGHRHTYFFGNPKFYASTADKFRLSSVTIEYMNGTKKVLSGAELKKRVKYSD